MRDINDSQRNENIGLELLGDDSDTFYIRKYRKGNPQCSIFFVNRKGGDWTYSGEPTVWKRLKTVRRVLEDYLRRYRGSQQDFEFQIIGY